MSYLDCGCWYGPWHAVIPPPQCPTHAGPVDRVGMFPDDEFRRIPWRRARPPWSSPGVVPNTTPTPSLPTPFPPWTIGGAGTASAPLAIQAPGAASLEDSIKAALVHVQTELAAAMERGDEVALDAWREAYEQLQYAIIMITRARKAAQA